MKALRIAGITLLAVGLAGCAASPSESNATRTVVPEAPQTPAVSTRCQPVDQTTIDAIMSGVDEGITLTQWQAVRSDDYEQVWFVSAVAHDAGFDGDPFTFATNDDPTQPGVEGLTLAADGFAHQFSTWPYGPDTNIGVQFVDDGGEESRDCALTAG